MKRILVTILMILYMAGAMGATVHLHYCMGEYVGATMLHKEEHKCDKCGMTKRTDSDNGCCKDEHKTFKAAEHSASKVAFEPGIILPALLPAAYSLAYYHYSPLAACITTTSLANGPPLPWHAQPIYLFVGNFRI